MLEGFSGIEIIVLIMGSLTLMALAFMALTIANQDEDEISEVVEEIYARIEKFGGKNVDIAFEGDIYLEQGRKWRFLVNYDDAHGVRQTYHVSLYVDAQAKPLSDLRWFIRA